VLRDKSFRQALSLAIDRAQVINVAWNGSGTPQQATISPQSPVFAGTLGQNLLHAWQQAYATQNVTTATANLDALGMTIGGDGFRTLPVTHDPFILIIDETNGPSDQYWKATQEVAQEWRDNLHIQVEVRDYRGDASSDADQRMRQGWSMIQSRSMSELDIWAYPDWIFAARNNYAFPLEGLYYVSGGNQGEAPQAGSPGELLQSFYNLGMSKQDESERIDIARQAIQNVYIDQGPFLIGITGDYQAPAIAKNTMHNVLNFGVLGPWAPGVPSNQDPSEWWMDTP